MLGLCVCGCCSSCVYTRCVCARTGRGGQPGHRSAIPWQAVKHWCDAGSHAKEYRPQGTGGSRRRRLWHRKSGCCPYAEGALTRRNMGGSPSTLHYVGRCQRPAVEGVSGLAGFGVFRAEPLRNRQKLRPRQPLQSSCNVPLIAPVLATLGRCHPPGRFCQV